MATNLKIAGLMEMQDQIKEMIMTENEKRQKLEDVFGRHEGTLEDAYNYLAERIKERQVEQEEMATNPKVEELMALEVLVNKIMHIEQRKCQILDDLFSGFNLCLFKGTREEAYECYHEHYLFREGITVEDVHEYLIELLTKQRGEAVSG